MYRYTIRMDESEFTSEEISQDEYEIGERMPLGEEGGEVIYDENGEEVTTIFPGTVYGTIVGKERMS